LSKLAPATQGLSSSPGAINTATEIAQQPEVWAEAAANIDHTRQELDAFLTPLLEDARLRIILTGAGTSAFIGQVAAPALSRILHRRVDALGTTDIVSNPAEYFSEDIPTLLVSFARSGNSPESIAATRLANDFLTDVSHLIITCDDQGKLFAEHAGQTKSQTVLMPTKANDKAFAMTSSFTSMLLSCLLIFAGKNDEIVSSLAVAASTLILQPDFFADLSKQGFNRVVYLGSGSLSGLARESALKLLELTAGKIVTYHDSSLGFRHGPKAVIDKSTLVVIYLSSDPYTRLYDVDIVNELRGTMKPGSVIVVSAGSIAAEQEPAQVLAGLDRVDDSYLAVAFIVFAQMLGLAFSQTLGFTSDNPFPGGDVNRVVTGVTIHPSEVSARRMALDS
jgi:tagatose-6-phosphate ketose/aldose isomerase